MTGRKPVEIDAVVSTSKHVQNHTMRSRRTWDGGGKNSPCPWISDFGFVADHPKCTTEVIVGSGSLAESKCAIRSAKGIIAEVRVLSGRAVLADLSLDGKPFREILKQRVK